MSIADITAQFLLFNNNYNNNNNNKFADVSLTYVILIRDDDVIMFFFYDDGITFAYPRVKQSPLYSVTNTFVEIDREKEEIRNHESNYDVNRLLYIFLRFISRITYPEKTKKENKLKFKEIHFKKHEIC